MYEYGHGGNAVFEPGSGNILDLSANINPLGTPKNVADAVMAALPFITRYPDSLSRELRAGIAEWEQTEPERVFCGNGASDVIFRLPVCVRPKEALVTAPSFLDYERALKAFGAVITRHELREENGFALDGRILETLSGRSVGIVFICNPNNPTGVLTERSLIEQIVSFCAGKGAYVIVDECFIDFVENAERYTAKPLLEKYDNLVILKAFTKIFALPGIRLGYALCRSEALIEGLYENGADWPVSNIAQAAGLAALQNAGAYLAESVSFINAERELISKELADMSFITFDSRANYLFFKNPYRADLSARLSERGIRIRNCGNYAGLSSDFFRVAVSSRENNKRYIKVMREIWN